ncbi:MAG: hypothetical protein U0Z44_17140 [Kouleothrix sp.]
MVIAGRSSPTSGALVTRASAVERPRFPVIDAHNHLGPEFGGGWDARPLAELLAAMDAADVRVLVDLDGGWGELHTGSAPGAVQAGRA